MLSYVLAPKSFQIPGFIRTTIQTGLQIFSPSVDSSAHNGFDL